MEHEIITGIVSQGAWASIFLLLLFYVLKTNDKRECKYQDSISELTKACQVMQEVKNDVSEIKTILRK